MKKRSYQITGLIGIALLCCAAALFLGIREPLAGTECFCATLESAEAGYHTLLIDAEQAQEGTLSVFINGVFARKAVFSGEAETAEVPAYLKKGKNSISLRVAAGDLERKITQIAAEKRASKTKMVIAPHQDDEALAFAGTIMHMLENGDDVIVVFATNGDWKGKEMGMERLAESARALQIMGVPRENIIVMGYPDAELEQLLAAGSSRKVLKLDYGEEYTYGNPAEQLYDFHTLQHGVAASMTGRHIRRDLLQILSVHMPSEIFLASQYDLHSDHASTYHLTREVLKKLWKNGAYSPQLNVTVIHGFDDERWPERLIRSESGEPVIQAFTAPFPPEEMPYDWNEAVHIQLTPEMFERKQKAISMYYTQNVIMGWEDQNYAYLKSDEFYWAEEYKP